MSLSVSYSFVESQKRLISLTLKTFFSASEIKSTGEYRNLALKILNKSMDYINFQFKSLLVMVSNDVMLRKSI